MWWTTVIKGRPILKGDCACHFEKDNKEVCKRVDSNFRQTPTSVVNEPPNFSLAKESH